MTKRAGQFARRKHDAYATPFPAVPPLARILPPLLYYEPCAGDGDLIRHLDRFGFTCVGSSDIQIGVDAMSLTRDNMNGAEAIITNPPWSRHLLHPMIEHFVTLVPEVWLLFDGDWMWTKQAAHIVGGLLTDIVPLPRLKWIPGSKHTAKDNACFYRFSLDKTSPAKFHERST